MTECTREQRFHCLCELQNVVPPKSLMTFGIRGSRGPQGLRRPRFSFSSSLVKEQHLTMHASGNAVARPTKVGDEPRCFRKRVVPSPSGRHRDEPHMGSPDSSVNTRINIFNSGADRIANDAASTDDETWPDRGRAIKPGILRKRLTPSRISAGVDGRLSSPARFPCQHA